MKTQTLFSDQPVAQYPYKIDIEGGVSGSFYKLLDFFSEEVVRKGLSIFNDIIGQYRKHSETHTDEVLFSEEENILDILIFGVLWNTYKGKWGNAIGIKRFVFNKLYEIRSNYSAIKPLTDKIRGKLMPVLDKPTDDKCPCTLDNIVKLSAWLSATGDFNEEVKRIEQWIAFLQKQAKSIVEKFLFDSERFSNWFETEAHMALNIFTKGVMPFLESHKELYYGAEDYFFTGRKEVEYHLNMVGAAIMNKSMSRDFLNTKQKILLLPSCMSKNEHCQASEIMGGQVCTHCTKGCSISTTVVEMKKCGIKVYVIKHSSCFSKYLSQWKNQQEIGLIGTACTLNLLMGGYEMKRLNIPAQCVFLDYPGCKKHWKTGIATSISIDQIDKLIGNVKLSYESNNIQVVCKIA